MGSISSYIQFQRHMWCKPKGLLTLEPEPPLVGEQLALGNPFDRTSPKRGKLVLRKNCGVNNRPTFFPNTPIAAQCRWVVSRLCRKRTIPPERKVTGSPPRDHSTRSGCCCASEGTCVSLWPIQYSYLKPVVRSFRTPKHCNFFITNPCAIYTNPC